MITPAREYMSCGKRLYTTGSIMQKAGNINCGYHMPGYTPYAQPGKPTVTVAAANSLNEAMFTWNTTANTSYYTIRFYDSNGNEIYLHGGLTRTYYKACLPAGRYSVKLASVNSDLGIWTFSDEVSFTVSSASAPSFSGDPAYETVWDHTLYQIYRSSLNWYEAESAASQAGGKLVSITSQAEQNIVAQAVAEFDGNCWIGAEVYRNDKWTWCSGETFSYNNWAPNEPSTGRGGENCAQIMKGTGFWNDTSADSDKGTSTYDVTGSVVEFKPTSISAFPMSDEYPEGTMLSAGDFMILVTFGGKIAYSTSDVTVSLTGTSAGTQTATISYGSVKTTCEVEFVQTLGKTDFVLPAGTLAVEEEAFRNCGMHSLRLPDGLESIGSYAFQGCASLTKVFMPESVVNVSGNAFDGCPQGLTIYGYPDSYAEAFAQTFGYEFVPVVE